MDKLKMMSENGIENNVEKIKLLFPNVITETKDKDGKLKYSVDFDKLKQELSEDLIYDEKDFRYKERYQLTWPGKRESILIANQPTTKTLRPVKQDSVDWDTTENLYIEGDNLEVLKILQESYLNKVKCI